MILASTINLAKCKPTPSCTTSIGAFFSYGVYLKQPTLQWESCPFITPFSLACIYIDETEDERNIRMLLVIFLNRVDIIQYPLIG
jgi:hypothetical protein